MRFLNATSPWLKATLVSRGVSQTPFFVTPIGTTSYSSRSTAPMTCSAETTDTSCSEERPPKIRPRRIARNQKPETRNQKGEARNKNQETRKTGPSPCLLHVAYCSFEAFADEGNLVFELDAELIAH